MEKEFYDLNLIKNITSNLFKAVNCHQFVCVCVCGLGLSCPPSSLITVECISLTSLLGIHRVPQVLKFWFEDFMIHIGLNSLELGISLIAGRSWYLLWLVATPDWAKAEVEVAYLLEALETTHWQDDGLYLLSVPPLSGVSHRVGSDETGECMLVEGWFLVPLTNWAIIPF